MFDRIIKNNHLFASRRRLASALLLFGLAVANTAQGGFEAGIEAHRQADFATAMDEFLDDGATGDTRSQYMIAEMYRLGHGVDVDMEQAAKWYRAAAEKGHPAAQNALGTLYAMGAGLEQDDVQAYVWFSLSTMMGNAIAEQNLARAKDLINSTNRKFGDQIINQYAPMYVFPFRPVPGFKGVQEGQTGFPGMQKQ